jgi:hypothetical protein
MKTHRTTTNNPKHIQANNAAENTQAIRSILAFRSHFYGFSEGEGEDTCKSSKKWNILIPFTATAAHTLSAPDTRIWKWFRFIYLHASRFSSFPVPVCCWARETRKFLLAFRGGKKETEEKGDGGDFDYPIEFHFNKFLSSTSHSSRTEKTCYELNLIKSFMKMWKDWPGMDVSGFLQRTGSSEYRNYLRQPEGAAASGEEFNNKTTKDFASPVRACLVWCGMKNLLEIEILCGFLGFRAGEKFSFRAEIGNSFGSFG